MTPQESKELLRKVWEGEEEPIILVGKKVQCSAGRIRVASIIEGLEVMEDRIVMTIVRHNKLQTLTKMFRTLRSAPPSTTSN